MFFTQICRPIAAPARMPLPGVAGERTPLPEEDFKLVLGFWNERV